MEITTQPAHHSCHTSYLQFGSFYSKAELAEWVGGAKWLKQNDITICINFSFILRVIESSDGRPWNFIVFLWFSHLHLCLLWRWRAVTWIICTVRNSSVPAYLNLNLWNVMKWNEIVRYCIHSFLVGWVNNYFWRTTTFSYSKVIHT